MSQATQERALITKYHTLAQDRKTQPVVARRNTIPTLMKFVQHQDHEIARIAAHTIELLTSHPENPEFMCREQGFLALMYNMFKDTEIENPELHDIFAKIFDNLRPALNPAENDENTPPPSGAKKISRSDGESARISKYRSSRVLVSANTAASRNVKLSFEGIETSSISSTKIELEDLFQTIRGVISYSIAADCQSATLLLSTPTPTLLKVLTDSGFSCNVEEESDVCDADNGSCFGTGSRFLNKGYFNPDSDFRKSLVPHGVDGNSLSDRLKRQKEEQLRKKKAADTNGIKSFISTLTTGWW